MYASEKHPGGVTVTLWVSTKAWTPPGFLKNEEAPGGYAAVCEPARKTAL